MRRPNCVPIMTADAFSGMLLQEMAWKHTHAKHATDLEIIKRCKCWLCWDCQTMTIFPDVLMVCGEAEKKFFKKWKARIVSKSLPLGREQPKKIKSAKRKVRR